MLDQGGGNHDAQRLLKQKLARLLRNPTTPSQGILKARTTAARGRVALNNCQAYSSKTKDGHAGATLGRNGSELKPFAKETQGLDLLVWASIIRQAALARLMWQGIITHYLCC